MYNTSTALASALSTQKLYIKVVCGSTTIGAEQVKKCVYSAAFGGADSVTIGGVTAASVSMTLSGAYALKDKAVTVSVGAEVNGAVQYVPLGTFVVTTCKQGDGTTTLTAYDAAYYALGGTYTPTVSSGATVAAVLADVAAQCGLSVATLPAAASTTTVTGDLTGKTCREMVGYLAALVGCNALIDRDGKLALRWFAGSGQSYEPGDYYNAGLSIDGTNTLTCIRAEVEKSTTDADGNTSVTTNTYTAGGTGAGVTIQNPYMTQEILNAVWASIGGLTCAVGSCSIFHGLLVEPGDLVTITDKAGTAHTLAVMTLELSIDGGCRARIQATADSTTDTSANVSGSMTKQINKIADAVTEFYTIVAQKAKVTDLEATNAEIANLKTEKADVKDLTADAGRIDRLETDVAEAGELIAKKANITDLNATNAEIDALKTNKANVVDLTAANAEIASLKTEKADVDLLNVAQAVIENLLVRGGIITDSVTGVNINATKYLTGVTIIGDVIKAGTLAADRIILTGNNGLIYELNAKAGNLTATQLTEAQYKQALDGSVLVAKSITTDKLAAGSVTAQVIASKAITADKLAANAVETNHIAAGAVTAEKLTVDTALIDKLFANDIEAKNTIKGVTLEGTTINGATIDGVTINGVTINGATIKGEAIDIQADVEKDSVGAYSTFRLYTDSENDSPTFHIRVKHVQSGYHSDMTQNATDISFAAATVTLAGDFIEIGANNSDVTLKGTVNMNADVYINNMRPYITAGDTVKISTAYCAGGVTSSTKTLYFYIPMARPIVDVSSVTISNASSAQITARKPAGGYIVQNAAPSSLGTITCKAYENGVTVSIKASSAYDATNNTPTTVSVENLQLKFT